MASGPAELINCHSTFGCADVNGISEMDFKSRTDRQPVYLRWEVRSREVSRAAALLVCEWAVAYLTVEGMYLGSPFWTHLGTSNHLFRSRRTCLDQTGPHAHALRPGVTALSPGVCAFDSETGTSAPLAGRTARAGGLDSRGFVSGSGCAYRRLRRTGWRL